MEKQEGCPICGTINKLTYFTESIGLVEDYYNCTNCGYFRHMCYSKPLIGFTIPNGKTEKEILKEFGAEIIKNNLKFIPPECLP